MAVLTVSEARAALPELLSRVEEGEQITITRHGRPVAVLVRPDIMRARAHVVFEDAERIHQLLAVAAEADLPAGSGPSERRAEELISQIRAERDSR